MRKTVSPGLTEEHTCPHLKGKEWQNGSDGKSAGGANIPIRRCPPAAPTAALTAIRPFASQGLSRCLVIIFLSVLC